MLQSHPQETQDQLPAGCPAGGSAVLDASTTEEGAEGEEWAPREGASRWRRRASQRCRTPRCRAPRCRAPWHRAPRGSAVRSRPPWERQNRERTANQRQTWRREGDQPSHHKEAQQQKDPVSGKAQNNKKTLHLVALESSHIIIVNHS